MNESKKYLLLKNRNYSLIWIGQLVSNLGTSFYRVAYMWWLAEVSNSAVTVSFAVILSMIPSIIISPFAGKFADEFNKKHIIVIADLIQGIIILIITKKAFDNNLTVNDIYISAVLTSLVMSFFRPAIFSIIPSIVEKEDLVNANSLNSISSNISALLGTSLSGIIIYVMGIKVAFLFNGLSFLFSSISEIFIVYSSATSVKSSSKRRFFKDTFESSIKVFNTSMVKPGIILFTLVNFFVTPVIVLAPFLANKLSLNATFYGFMKTFEALGMISISFILSLPSMRKFINEKLILYFSVSMISGSLFFIGFSKNQLIILCSFFIFGVGIASTGIYLNKFFQSNIDKENLGLFSGLRGMIGDIIMPLGLLLSGIFTEIVSMEFIFVLSSFCILCSLLIVFHINKVLFKVASNEV